MNNENAELLKIKEELTQARKAIKVLNQRNSQYLSLLDNESSKHVDTQKRPLNSDREFDGLTLIIAYYDIPMQIERTLVSCSPEYQGSDPSQIEIIIVDNGSTQPFPEELKERYPFISKVIRVENESSPAVGLNKAIGSAYFSTVGLMIDGAHILSPGIFSCTRDISRMFERPVINVPQYILGKISQNLNPSRNAFQREEEALRKLNWPKNSRALFEYALFPGENYERSCFSAIESNCLISTKAVFASCGAYDERFNEAGGGFANLEIYSRLVNNLENTYVMLPGEGSFHQDHGGTTTGKSLKDRGDAVEKYWVNYKEITGSDILFNPRSPFIYGSVGLKTLAIPTISAEFGRRKNKILSELAEIYTARAQTGIKGGNHPILASSIVANERKAFTPLSPLKLLQKEPRFSKASKSEFSYLKMMKEVHKAKKPNLYFEIGVDTGASMSLSKCRSVGVDPDYHVTHQISAYASLIRMKSDDFFVSPECEHFLAEGIDFAFIDGMHLSEYVLRDFINVEAKANRNGVVVFDDVLPEQLEMADRNRQYNAWCGDVYKIIPILRKYRPDLEIDVFEAFIGPYRKGIALIRNLNPKNNILTSNFDKIAKEISCAKYTVESIQELEELVKVSDMLRFKEIIESISSEG